MPQEPMTNVIFAHLHMAKTAGTTINAMLAHGYERVCGVKGYSYDAHQANQRHNAAGGGSVSISKDSFTKLHGGMNRVRVPGDIMNEIGFEDCDWISHEVGAQWWPPLVDTFKGYSLSVEMHVPCRSPLDHLMSMCNFRNTKFNCTANLEGEVKDCLMTQGRFSKKLLKVDNLTLRCFDPVPPTNYVKFVGNLLQKKRIDGGELGHRSTNLPREKSAECLWGEDNSKVRQEVLRIMMTYEYFSWCQECLNSDRDLLVDP